MKKFKAYTCKGYNEEKFYIEDTDERDLVVEAENTDKALVSFILHIKENSLCDERETRLWLARNPLYVVEI